MVSTDSFLGADRSVGHLSHQDDQLERRFRKIDLPAKQSQTGTVTFRLANKLKGVPGRSGTASENADDQLGVICGKLLERLRTVEGDLQKLVSLGLGQSSQGLQNDVVEELACLRRIKANVDIG